VSSWRPRLLPLSATSCRLQKSPLPSGQAGLLRPSTKLHRPSCDVKVIPNFVNLQEYRPGEPGAKNSLAPEGGRVITHVSNFREVKRVKDVVRVFARIRRAMPATLIMVGDGPERVDAENEARELGVTKATP
jgi:L-malate glycosyltransferase